MRCLRRVRRSDSGLTLIELLVAASMLLVVMGMVTGAIISALNASNQANAETGNQQVARAALDRVTQALRQAVASPLPGEAPFLVASPTTATFYRSGLYASPGDIWAAPTKVTLAVDQSGGIPGCPASAAPCLTSTETPPAGSGASVTYPAAGAQATVWAQHVTLPVGKPVFTYLACRDAMSGTNTYLPVDASGSVTSAGLGHIYAVEVRLAVLNAGKVSAQLEDRAALAIPPVDPYASTPEPC